MEPANDHLPPWIRVLSEEDWQFLRRFLLTSGSLKDLAAEYGISYPTVRARLDRLIEKVKAVEEVRWAEPFRLLLRSLVIDGRLDYGTAREILRQHEKSIREKERYDRELV